MSGLEGYLVSLPDGMKTLGAPTSFPDFLLRNERAFPGRPLPARYTLKMPRLCYWNRHLLVRKSKRLRHCEGYVSVSDLPIPIQHARAIDTKDQVVNVTPKITRPARTAAGWRNISGSSLSAATWLQISLLWAPRLDIRFDIDPEFKKFLEAA